MAESQGILQSEKGSRKAKVVEEVFEHVCPECGIKWECGSRLCLQNRQTKCNTCPCGLPECGLMEPQSDFRFEK